MPVPGPSSIRILSTFAALVMAAALAACGGRGGGQAPQAPLQMGMLKSVSPALIKAAPMARTRLLPAGAMKSPPSRMVDITGLNWSPLPGSASQVAASSDGSIWVLSTQPSGPDKYIWHYVSGTWTNISGLAAHLAVAPNNTLYALNSGGGIYAYSGGTWSALGGGGSGITAAADDSIYALSNGGTGNQAIWHNVSGTWSQVPGAGVALAASWDPTAYTVPGGSISPDGLYVLNSAGSIYYENTAGSFATVPAAASAIAPTTSGGAFVLGYPSNSGGNTIYYYNLNTPGWSSQSGAGVSISTNGTNLYVIGASGAIYSSPLFAPVALQIVNNNNPSIMPSSSINLYVYGQLPGSAGPTWQYVTATGSTVTMTNNGANIPPIPFGSGSKSSTIYLPNLTSARIYIVGGTFNFNIPPSAPNGAGPSPPAPWTNDGTQSTYFDYVEYTWNPGTAMNVDTTQVDSFNLALSVTLVGASTSTFGFLSGAVGQLHSSLATDGGEWANLNAQWPYRVMNPGHGNVTGFFLDPTFLDTAIKTAWDAYQSQWMTLDLTGAGFSTYYGQVDANENFQFYTAESTSGAPVATIVSPFSTANKALWGPPTMQMLANSGAFTNVPSGQNASLVGAVGNRVVGALNRGTFATLAQPACGVTQYPGAAYQNQYANALHAVANNPQYGFGGAYAFAFDDSCTTSTDTSQASPTSMTITINPS